MTTSCEIIRDLLPLYADDVLSDASRGLVEAHLPECPECAQMLKQLRDNTLESALKDESALVIRHQERRFKRRSAAVGSVIAALFMIPILICLIVNMSSSRTLDWFYVASAGMLVAASLIVVPLMVPENKLFWTFCAFDVSLMVLLAVSAAYSHGRWFFVAASATQFGLAVVFLPFLIRAKPLKKRLEGHNKALLVIAIDLILFANMMNMITLRTKSLLTTIAMVGLCVAGVGFISAVNNGKGNAK